MRLWLAAWAALCGVAILGSAAASRAGDLVVVEARGIGLNPGEMLDDAKPLLLQEGQHVTLIAVNGATLKFDGPFDQSPAAAEASSGGELGVALTKLVTEQEARGLAGIVRGGAAKVTLPDPWLMDVSHTGNVCLRQDATALFWRENAGAPGRFSLMPGDHSWKAEAEWPQGSQIMTVPPDLPLHAGTTYLVTLDGSESAVTVNLVPAELRGDAMRAAWMSHQGCEAQAEALARTLQ
jgi:hypothetical protein